MGKNRVIRIYFVLGLLGLFLLCFTGSLGFIDGREVSVWTVMTQYNQTVRNRYSSLSVYTSGFGSWFLMLLPIAAAFPTIPLFCDEHISKFDLFIVNRIGLYHYVRKTYFFTVLYGMLLAAGALLLYGIVVGSVFPLKADWGTIEFIGEDKNLLWSELKGAIASTLAYTLWSGAVAGVSYLFASIGNNIYINLTLPFLFNYLIQNYIEHQVLLWAIVTIVLTYFMSGRIWKCKGRMYGT